MPSERDNIYFNHAKSVSSCSISITIRAVIMIVEELGGGLLEIGDEV